MSGIRVALSGDFLKSDGSLTFPDFDVANSNCQQFPSPNCCAIFSSSSTREKSGATSPPSAAYTTYGPVSPSKLSASCKSDQQPIFFASL